jgi:hypothetical protein
LLDLTWREDVRVFAEGIGVDRCVAAHRLKPRAIRGGKRAVKRGDRVAQRFGQRVRYALALGDAGEQPVLVEPLHHQGHLDDLARAVECEALALARDLGDAEVGVRRRTAIDGELLLHCRAAFGERGEVEKAQIDPLLHLVGALARQEHVAAGRLNHVDLGVRREAVARGIGQPGDKGGVFGHEAGIAQTRRAVQGA